MPKLRELLDAFHYNPETFNEAEFKSAVLSAYEEDETVWNSAVTAKDGEISQAQAKLTEVQAENWKLFTKLGTPITPDNAGGSTVPPLKSEDQNEPELKGVGSFLTPVKKE